MSGWVKWQKDIETDPLFKRMVGRYCSECNAPEFQAVTLLVGCLLRLWVQADSHICRDNTMSMGFEEINRMLGVPGFCRFMPSQWLIEIDFETVELPDWLEGNGTEAKKKAQTARRVENLRIRNSNAGALPDQTRPDQTRPCEIAPPPLVRAEPTGQEAEAWGDVTGIHPPAFERWLKYLQEPPNPKHLNGITRIAAAKELAGYGDAAKQLKAVEHCIARGWRNLREMKADAPRPGGYQQQRSSDQSTAQERQLADQVALNRLKSQRESMGIPDFRDPEPHESPAIYETAMKLEQRSARSSPVGQPRTFR